MNIYLVVACMSLAIVLAVIALIREARLRRALQALLRRLLLHWKIHDQAPTDTADSDRQRADRRL